MLTVNLSDELVNGLGGVVKEMNETSVVVYFETVSKNVTLNAFSFTKYNPALKKDVGCRRQIPLKLAYAITIHKAQGMTLNRMVLHCKGIFQFGQLAVGLSRARSKKGLQVIGFHRKILRTPPQCLMKFLEKTPLAFIPDLSCCRKKVEFTVPIPEVQHEQVTHVDEFPVENEDLESDAADNIDLLQAFDEIEKNANYHESKYQMPDNFDISKILDNLKHRTKHTEQQTNENMTIDFLLKNLDSSTKCSQDILNGISSVKENNFTGETDN